VNVRPKIYPTILVLSALILLPGCNIVRGVGQDMAAVGRTVAKTADRSGNSTGSEEHASDLPPAQSASADPTADYDYGWEN
jgi:predicted small secreted protein